jgi:hypothetical protein
VNRREAQARSFAFGFGRKERLENPPARSGTSLEDAVIHGARAQLRPTLMLILVALLGMVPARAGDRNRKRYPTPAGYRGGGRTAFYFVFDFVGAAEPVLFDGEERGAMKPPVKMLLIYVDETDLWGRVRCTKPSYGASASWAWRARRRRRA